MFDEQEHAFVPSDCPGFPGPCVNPPPTFLPFPAATQRSTVGGAALPVPFTFGWFYLDLNDRKAAGPSQLADPGVQQAWVVAAQSSTRHFAVALDAFRLDDACAANHFVP